jgi:hypothetical protein
MSFSFPFLRRRLAASGDDLGLGTRDGPSRDVNKDGSFNLRRTGAPRFRPYELYHQLITMSVPRFTLILLFGNIAANLVFAGIYLAVGMEHFDRTGSWTPSSSAPRPSPPWATGTSTRSAPWPG